jgi:2-keto-4-pentenoate hydratase/2-oxohepta-3-ene-1,7-dioic acid hydratase in catechol pathway
VKRFLRLVLRLLLNGRVMQDASIDQLIFSVSAIIEMISVAMSLEPGDVFEVDIEGWAS